jgi:NADH:ubiquinone oxidoreductase subunit 6 (subunit J)
VDYADAGLASSLINTGQVVGGSIGLAILGTVAWTVVVNTARNAAHAAGSAAHAADSAQVSISGHALAAGFSRGFEVSAAIMVLALVVAAIMIRVSRQDLTGAQP